MCTQLCPCGSREGRSLASTAVNLNKKSVCRALFSIIVMLSPVRVFLFNRMFFYIFGLLKMKLGVHRISIYWNIYLFVFQILSPISSPVEFPQYIPEVQIFPRMTHWDIPRFLSGPSEIPRQGRGCGAGHNRRPFLPLKVALRLLKLSASQCYRSNQALSDWSSCLALWTESNPCDCLSHALGRTEH